MGKKKPRTNSKSGQDHATGNATSNKKTLQPKDKDEEELEKLVFPDLVGWELHDGSFVEEDSANESETALVPLPEDGEGENAYAALNDDELFFIDTSAGPGGELTKVDSPTQGDSAAAELTSQEQKPAWEDSDDDRITVSLMAEQRLRKYRLSEAENLVTGREYSRRLRYQYERLYPVPQWSLPPKEKKRRKRDSNSSDSNPSGESDIDVEGMETTHRAEPLHKLLQSSSGYISQSKSNNKLRPGTLNISRLQEANHLAPSQSSISSISFHPTHPLLLSAGIDHTLRIYHIDGKVNPPVTSLHIHQSAIQTAIFHPDGKRVFAGGRRKYFFIWDLESGSVERVTRIYGHQNVQKSMENFKISPDGRYMSLVGSKGHINILDCNSGQWVTSATIDVPIADHVWSHDSSSIIIAGKGSQIWEYSIAAREFSCRWWDEGGVNTTKIAQGGHKDRWLAVGGNTGIVNIYDRHKSKVAEGTMDGQPKPLKVVEQLVTPVTDLGFSADGQILCIASTLKRDALRMVHLPTCTVYQNWPTNQTPLGRIDSFAFAPHTLMFAAGNDQGKIRLWEIRS